MKNIKNKEIEPYNNIYLGMHATFSSSADGIWGKLGYRGSGYMPEELCQVSPKLHYVSLASHSDPNPYILFSSNLSYIVSFCQSKAENTPWFAKARI